MIANGNMSLKVGVRCLELLTPVLVESVVNRSRLIFKLQHGKSAQLICHLTITMPPLGSRRASCLMRGSP